MSSFVERVKQIIAYDPLSGVFTWKENRGGSAKVGSKAGAYREADGYTHIFIFGKQWLAHRLAWTLENNLIPDCMEVDHIDGDRQNNAIRNLRLATSSQNKFNACLRKDSVTGVKGVGYDKKRKKWTGRVRADGEIVRARFDSMEEAAEFCESQRLNLHGEFLSNGERK